MYLQIRISKKNNCLYLAVIALPELKNVLFLSLDSPRSFWWYHLLCWLMSAVGVVCILVAHEHYSVDVVVAYFITSRLFYWYHTMANVQVYFPHVLNM